VQKARAELSQKKQAYTTAHNDYINAVGSIGNKHQIKIRDLEDLKGKLTSALDAHWHAADYYYKVYEQHQDNKKKMKDIDEENKAKTKKAK